MADRDVVFKTEIPEDPDLLSLANEILPIWRPLGVSLGLKNATLDGIDLDKRAVLDKSYAMLMAWKQLLGPGASYQALAEGLNHPVFERHNLVVKYCYDNAHRPLSPSSDSSRRRNRWSSPDDDQ